MLSRNGEIMKMYEKVVGFGLGYLVYKRIMSELAMEPVKEGVTVKAGDMFGFGKLTAEEIRKAYIGPKTEGTFSDIWKQPGGPPPIQWPKLGEDAPPLPEGGTWGTPTEDWGSLQRPTILFPEGFELVGPSRTGITRPKGLD